MPVPVGSADSGPIIAVGIQPHHDTSRAPSADSSLRRGSSADQDSLAADLPGSHIGILLRCRAKGSCGSIAESFRIDHLLDRLLLWIASC